MGKKRIAKKSGEEGAGTRGSSARASRRKLERGVLAVEATYNNTKVSLADEAGNVVAWSSAGGPRFLGG